MLEQDLAAAPAGHEHGPAGVADRDRAEAATTGRNQVTDQYTFGAEAQPV
ncbi:hypothetical protein NSERUTF1_1237 [Nocardia seriolae]|nr:hypothetical protein NSERUTF1_1237 [Nocardia seriolae]